MHKATFFRVIINFNVDINSLGPTTISRKSGGTKQAVTHRWRDMAHASAHSPLSYQNTQGNVKRKTKEKEQRKNKTKKHKKTNC